MNRINIEQNNEILKRVDDSLIEYMYNLFKESDTEELDQYLKGRLEINHGYADAVEYLINKFNDLYIISLGDLYIRFKDSTVQSILANKWGDGLGITSVQAAQQTSGNQLKTLFVNNTNITSFDELSYFTNITSLPSETFRGCANLESIDLSNVEYLNGDNTFMSCSNLKYVKGIENLIGCGGSTFNGCDLIGDYDFSNISEAIRSDGYMLGFSNNIHLTSIKLPLIATKMPRCYGCKSLRSITNTDNIDSIPSENLRGCTSLETLNLPLCTSIGSSGCLDCTSLTSINMPFLTVITQGTVFCNCTSLTTVNMPNLTSITGSSTFNKCTSLVSLQLQKLTNITGSNTFYDCSNLESITLGEITSIPDGTFYQCVKLETINGVDWSKITYIGTNAFVRCNLFKNNDEPLILTNATVVKNLPPYVSTIKLPSLVNMTNNWAGNGVNHIELNTGMTELSNSFQEMDNLIDVTNLGNITSICNYCFKGCDNLKTLDFSNKLVSIGNEAFRGDKKLTSITNDTLTPTTIGSYAFHECSLLVLSINLSQCANISNSAFYNCVSFNFTGLTQLTSIGSYAFSKCLIEEIDLSHCTSIGNNAFEACINLSQISLSSIESLGTSVFKGCKKLTSASLPEGLTEIPGNLFYECELLTSVNIPSTVTLINGGAFISCKQLSALTIPSNVTYIGYACFANDNKLVLTFEGTTPPEIGESAYHQIKQIRVPNAAVETYKSAYSNWSNIIVGY